jgi:hypothetical protein
LTTDRRILLFFTESVWPSSAVPSQMLHAWDSVGFVAGSVDLKWIGSMFCFGSICIGSDIFQLY